MPSFHKAKASPWIPEHFLSTNPNLPHGRLAFDRRDFAIVESVPAFLSFRRVRFVENSRLYVLSFSVVRLLISVAICFAVGLFVLVQVTIAI